MYTGDFYMKPEEKEQSVPISARVPLNLFVDIHKELKETKQTISEFLKEAAEEKLLNDNGEALDSEIKYMEKKIGVLKAKKEQIKFKEKDMDEIPSNEISFLRETKEILIESPTYIKGRINLYKNRFDKHYRISEQEFWELLEKAETNKK